MFHVKHKNLTWTLQGYVLMRNFSARSLVRMIDNYSHVLFLLFCKNALVTARTMKTQCMELHEELNPLNDHVWDLSQFEISHELIVAVEE